MRLLFVIQLLIFTPLFITAQSVGVPLGTDTYHIVDRLDIKTGLSSEIHTGVKYYGRRDVARLAMKIDTSLIRLSLKDRRDLYYIFRDNNDWIGQNKGAVTVSSQNTDEQVYIDSTKTFYKLKTTENQSSIQSDYYIESKKPILKYFYRTPANLFELNKQHFYLKVNSIINFKLAKSDNEEDILFDNLRGIAVRGGVDGKVFFYTEVQESQTRFANYVNTRIERDRAIPGAGFFKNYESSIFDSKNGYDFLNAQGYLGLNITKHVGLQIGHGRNFIGNGYRSIFLSDFANNYFYLKLNTRVWKFHYQNIFAELSASGSLDDDGDELLPKKYMAAHYLSCNINKNLSIGFFESVVFGRGDNFELNYLNPVILYRTIEQYIGSPDNVMIGLDFKWNLLQRFSLYGQLMIDEFVFSELLVERNGWWANKNGVQLGLKYIDVFGIDHLDGQVEFNTVRPYTYTHSDSTANYAHYNQALAHPLGANFKELILRAKYPLTKKLTLDARFIHVNYGLDSDSLNYGNNILLSNRTRGPDYGNETSQGIKTTTQILGLDLSYQVFHNMYVDLHYFYRKQDADVDQYDQNTSYIGGGVRVNFARRKLDF